MTKSSDLEDIFEEVLEELNQGYKDEAAMLQAEALSESTDLMELKKLYLQIRAKKIHKQRIETEKQLEAEKQKTKSSNERQKEKQGIKFRLLVVAFFGIGLAILGLSYDAMSMPVIDILIFIAVAWFVPGALSRGMILVMINFPIS